MLAVGVWAKFEKNNPYTQLNRLPKFYLDPAQMLIIIGALTFAIGFSGALFSTPFLTLNLIFLRLHRSSSRKHILFGDLFLTFGSIVTRRARYCRCWIYKQGLDWSGTKNTSGWYGISWVCLKFNFLVSGSSLSRRSWSSNSNWLDANGLALLWNQQTGRLGHEHLFQLFRKSIKVGRSGWSSVFVLCKQHGTSKLCLWTSGACYGCEWFYLINLELE